MPEADIVHAAAAQLFPVLYHGAAQARAEREHHGSFALTSAHIDLADERGGGVVDHDYLAAETRFERAAQIEPRKARQRRRGIGDLSAAVVDVARRADADDGAVRARAVIVDRLADILHDMISAVFRLGGHGRTMQDLVRSALARPAAANERGLDARAAYIHADQLHFITCTKRLVMSMGRVIELPMTTA